MVWWDCSQLRLYYRQMWEPLKESSCADKCERKVPKYPLFNLLGNQEARKGIVRKSAKRRSWGVIGDTAGVSIPTLDKPPGFVVY